MAEHVKTACRDCKKCTNSMGANAGRDTGRPTAAFVTVGLSEIGFAMRKKCRLCGHQMSLHAGAEAPTVQPTVVMAAAPTQAPAPVGAAQPAAPQGPPPGWYLDPDGGSLQRWWDGTRWTEFKQGSSLPQSDMSEGEHQVTPVAPASVAEVPLESPRSVVPNTARPEAGNVGPHAPDGSPVSLGTPPSQPESASAVGASGMIEPGHLVCDGNQVRFGIRFWGRDQTEHLKLSKLGHSGPIQVKISKDGTLEMHLVPGTSTLKGLTPELCAADLAAIAAYRPDVPVEASTPEVANALRSAGVTLQIWDHH
jgi:hypothetical protein